MKDNVLCRPTKGDKNLEPGFEINLERDGSNEKLKISLKNVDPVLFQKTDNKTLLLGILSIIVSSSIIVY